MTPEGIKAEGEEEMTSYTPGVWGKAILDVAEKHGSRLTRWAGGPLSVVQAQRDDSGIWHFWRGTVEEMKPATV